MAKDFAKSKCFIMTDNGYEEITYEELLLREEADLSLIHIFSVALSQIGNIGGEPYWSWYGFNSRVEWCACCLLYTSRCV